MNNGFDNRNGEMTVDEEIAQMRESFQMGRFELDFDGMDTMTVMQRAEFVRRGLYAQRVALPENEGRLVNDLNAASDREDFYPNAHLICEKMIAASELRRDRAQSAFEAALREIRVNPGKKAMGIRRTVDEKHDAAVARKLAEERRRIDVQKKEMEKYLRLAPDSPYTAMARTLLMQNEENYRLTEQYLLVQATVAKYEAYEKSGVLVEEEKKLYALAKEAEQSSKLVLENHKQSAYLLQECDATMRLDNKQLTMQLHGKLLNCAKDPLGFIEIPAEMTKRILEAGVMERWDAYTRVVQEHKNLKGFHPARSISLQRELKQAEKAYEESISYVQEWKKAGKGDFELPGVSYDRLTKDQRDAIDEAMAASNPEATAEINQNRHAYAMEGYRSTLLSVIEGIDKSPYADVYNNKKISGRILDFLERDNAIRKIGYEEQLAHYSRIVDEHIAHQDRCAEITRKAQREGQAALTDDERRTLESKTQLQTLLGNVTKNYFEQQRAEYLETIEKQKNLYAKRLVNSPNVTTPEVFKKDLTFNLDLLASDTLWNNKTKKTESTLLYRFHESDLPKFVYDRDALDEYVKSYDKYVRANLQHVAREVKIRDLGKDATHLGETFLSMGRDPSYSDLPRAQFLALHDTMEKKYVQAKEKYESFVKETESSPDYKAHLSSPEYTTILNMEYYERKHEGKNLDQIPDAERAVHIANKYRGIGVMGVHRIPAEERALFDEGVLRQSMPYLLEMEAGLERTEKTMEKLWANASVQSPEQEFQRKELEENRAILSAYKAYALDNTKENQKNFYNEVNKAYDRAKQLYIDNPDLRDRFEVRAEQIRQGDFTFVPVSNRKDAKLYGMTANWDFMTYKDNERQELSKLPRSEAQKLYERAFAIHVDPLQRKTLRSEVHMDAQKRPEYTLKQMGQSLTGADLEDYKATIHNEKMEAFNATANGINREIKGYKDAQEALKQRYGIVGRIFNRDYKNQKAFLERHIKLCAKRYELCLKKTKYDILKTYEEKGLALTKEERRELNTLVSDGSRTGKIKDWDEERAQEKRRQDEMNAKWKSPEEKPQATKRQLDLGDKLHKAKVQEETVKETDAPQKEKEIGQRGDEDPNLSK